METLADFPYFHIEFDKDGGLVKPRAAREMIDFLADRANGVTDVFRGFAAVLAHKTPAEIAMLKIEVALGVFIGAVTFTGSVVAYGKLAGKIDGKPKKLPGGHMLNLGAAILSLLLLILCVAGWGPTMLWLILLTLVAGFIGWHLIMGIGGADMPVVVSMLNSYSG